MISIRHITKTAPFGSGFCGEPKASLTEYLEKNKEKLVLLQFNYSLAQTQF